MPTASEKKQVLVEPEPTTVIDALFAVMDDVRAVGKDSVNTEQHYRFRGIDAVVNAVGPAMRKHKLLAIPILNTASYRDVQTSRGKPSREVTVEVTYRFFGPKGDHIDAVVPGEAMDFGDKGTAKAMSVAMRIALLQVLALPTDEADPDDHVYERDNAPPPPPDPVNQAKAAVKEAWERHMFEPFSVDPAAEHFASWSGGEVLAEASAERLMEYVRHLETLTKEAQDKAAEQPALPADGEEGTKDA